jgi:hypothetical protein
MGRVGRWIAVIAVLGVLTLLAIVLYLLLEPFHRDDEDGARAAPVAIITAIAGEAGASRDYRSSATGTIARRPSTLTTRSRDNTMPRSRNATVETSAHAI